MARKKREEIEPLSPSLMPPGVDVAQEMGRDGETLRGVET